MAAARKKPILKLVEPNLDELERTLTETAAQMAPMIGRGSSTRAKFEAEVRALEGEREAVEARRELAKRHYDALMEGFGKELADIDRAIGLFTGGLTQDKLTAAE